MQCVELNRLCKHLKNVRSSQAFISMNSSAEFRKKQFVLVTIAKKPLRLFFSGLLFMSIMVTKVMHNNMKQIGDQ